MPAYFVSLFKSVTDRDMLEEYWNRIGATFEGFGVKVLAGYTRLEVVEERVPKGTVILEFPSFEQAVAWYGSPGYVAIRHLRTRSSTSSGIVVDGGVVPIAERMR